MIQFLAFFIFIFEYQSPTFSNKCTCVEHFGKKLQLYKTTANLLNRSIKHTNKQINEQTKKQKNQPNKKAYSNKKQTNLMLSVQSTRSC